MASPAPTDSLLGCTLIERYRVVREIGRGGMGVIYEAIHTGLGKSVAIKLMLEKYAHDPEAVVRFQREALAASRIGNPHIVDVMDIGVAPDGRSFVVMELLDGLPLSQVVARTGPMPTWRATAVIRQVLRAVGAAHAKGIVHRDLKPDNIFLIARDDQHDFVKLLDFGVSKIVDPDAPSTRLTTTGVVIGTPMYMAPEQALGDAVDHRADLYACGVILYELLGGRPPFDAPSYAALVAKLLTDPVPSLAALRPGLPGELVAAVHRALAKDPSGRFASAEQFAAALPADRGTSAQLELGETLDQSRRDQLGVVALPVVPPPRRPGRRAIGLALAGAAAVIAAATAFVVVPARGGSPAPPAPLPALPPGRAEPAARAAPATPPPAALGTLDIRSTPSGASVELDDEPSGTTPLTLRRPPGHYRLRVALPGHATVEEDAEVRIGDRTSLIVVLPAAPAGPPTRPAGRHPPGARPPPSVVHPPSPIQPYDTPPPPPVPTPATGSAMPNPY